MTTPLNSAIGGLLAALLAAVTIRLVGVLARRGTTENDLKRFRVPNRRRTLVLLLYGSLAGVALVILDSWLLGALSVPPTTAEAIGLALAWSVVLGVILAAFWLVTSRRGIDQDVGFEILGFHLVYGLLLGIWIRLTWIT